MIHGEHLQVAIGGTPLAGSKSCNVSKSQSFIGVCAPTNGRWEAFVPQKLSWGITADCLLATMDGYKALDAAWRAGTALTIRFYDTEFNENEQGTAYIEKLDLVCTKGSLAKMSISLKGSGELTIYTGTDIIPSESLLKSDMYYVYTYSGNYVVNSSDDGEIYGGSFTLSKRSLVQITTENDIFLSQNNAIVTKASNAEDILSTDYTNRINGNTKVWLDAGTWYFVDSNPNYQHNPTFKAIGL